MKDEKRNVKCGLQAKKGKNSQENVPKNAKILNYYKEFKSIILNMSKNKFKKSHLKNLKESIRRNEDYQ